MPPPPASLTIISWKYETDKDYNLTLNSLKQTTTRKNKHCAILQSLHRHCQSKAKHSRIWVQAMPFLPIKSWPSDIENGVQSCMKWATAVPILVFLGLSVLDLGPMYATDIRRGKTDVRQKHHLMPPPYGDRGIIISADHWWEISIVLVTQPTVSKHWRHQSTVWSLLQFNHVFLQRCLHSFDSCFPRQPV